MNPYEVMFIVSPNVEGDAVDQYIERFGRLVTESGGEVVAVDKWGKRRFAYEIQGLNEGYYVVMQFRADRNTVHELSRVMRITDDIVRHMVVRLDESQLKTAQKASQGAQAEQQAQPSEAGAAGAQGDSAAGGNQADAKQAARVTTASTGE